MKALALAALTAALPFVATAGELSLSKPLAGATLHDDLVDMSVYWVQSGTAFEVVAHYVTRTEATPHRLQMRLEEGDRVVFGLPGLPGLSYGFAREGGALTVTSAATRTDLALN